VKTEGEHTIFAIAAMFVYTNV